MFPAQFFFQKDESAASFAPKTVLQAFSFPIFATKKLKLKMLVKRKLLLVAGSAIATTCIAPDAANGKLLRHTATTPESDGGGAGATESTINSLPPQESFL